jgi:hypothetical protein
MSEFLADAGAQLQAEGARAMAHVWECWAELREADAALAGIASPCWDGTMVARYERARDDFIEAGETAQAWREFFPGCFP